MKKWNYFLGLGAVLSILTLTACSDDDEPKAPDMPDLGIFAPVSSIAGNGESSVFHYNDRGLITDGTDMHAGKFSINYAPFTVKFSDEAVKWKEATEMNNIVTDGNGFITSASLNYKEEWNTNGYDESRNETGTLTCQYNGNGELINIVYTMSDYDIIRENTCKFRWKDGNIYYIQYLYRSKEADKNWGKEYSKTITFEYGEDAVENSGIYMPNMADLGIDFLFYAGRFGKTCKLIPTWMTVREVDDTEEESSVRVEKDIKGRITSLKVDGSTIYAYAYDGERAEYLP